MFGYRQTQDREIAYFEITNDWNHTRKTNGKQIEFQPFRTYENHYISSRIIMRKQ